MKKIKNHPSIKNICFFILSAVIAVGIVVLILFLAIKIIANNNENKRLTIAKKESIAFLKENINDLEATCNEIIDSNENKCIKWNYQSICYNNGEIIIDETGLTSASWKLKFYNNRWYVIDKSSDKIIDITNNIK